MKARLLSLFAMLSCACFGQLQLFTFDGTTERPLTGITDIGSVAAGDSHETRFHARNPGLAAVTLQTVALAGQGFTLSAVPSLPYIVAPGNFAEVRVRFSASGTGSYSATLAVNDAQTILRATVVASANVSLVTNSVPSALAAGATIDFGRVQKNLSTVRTVRISNGTSARLSIQACGVTGGAFRAPALTCPLSLGPGETVSIDITFNPATAVSQQGTLTLDNRTFALTGVGFDVPLPEPSILFDAPLASGTQQRLVIQLASAAQSTGSGTVTMQFTPGTSGTPDDPAIRFTASGARSLSFQVAQGAQTASFPSGVDTGFQTGTTAGTLVFHLVMGDYDKQFSFPVAPVQVHVDQASVGRRVSDLDVSITGFDNTHSLGQFSFTFYDKNGNQVQPGAIHADWTQIFATYFSTSKAGGTFLLRATFPISGDATQLAGLEVEMTNSAGTARTTRISF